MLSATITHANKGQFTARVRNISAGGMMIHCPDGLPVGSQVEAQLRGIGAVGGTVAWSGGGHVGITFEREVDPKLTLSSVAARGPAAPPPPGTYRRPGFR